MSNSEFEGQIFEFTMTPLKEIFYSANVNSYFGIYAFQTDTKLPETDELCINDFDNKTINVYTSTIKGKTPKLSEGTNYNVKAKLVKNTKAKNGYSEWQYEIVNGDIQIKKPTTIENSKAFLTTILTNKQVESLLNIYPDIVNILINDCNFIPDFNKLKGIKEASFEKIKNKIFETYHMSDILILLQPLGISFNMIKKLFENENNIEILKDKINNYPYEFTNLDGIGFKKVDEFALKINPNLIKSEQRAIACTKYILEDIAENEGHTWTYFNSFIDKIKSLIPECGHEFISFYNKEKELMLQGENKFLFIDDKENRIGLLKYYNYEKHIYNKIKQISNSENIYSDINIEEGIKITNKKNGFDLTEEQIDIVDKVKNNNFVILTASAGCGKTTSIKAIIETFSKYNISICALSARAARRSREVTGLSNCYTIHKLLEYNPSTGMFEKNENNNLKEDIVILEEMSMVNIQLFMYLLDAIKPNAKFIMVGDISQLPPIGAGAIAQDLLLSKIFTTVKLTKIQRQGQNSGIAIDANKIREGETPLSTEEISPKSIVHGINKDMFYSLKLNSEHINIKVFETFKYLINNKNINPNDITIITPMKTNGENCTKKFNILIQDYLHENENKKIIYGDKEFRLGDRVIQKVNNYEKNIVNGEIGYIIKINEIKDSKNEEENYDLIVEFPDIDNNKIIKFKKSELSDMDLAYACTVHSMQGGECPYVIVVMDNSHYIMLDTTLFYTAVTRAKNECYVIATPDAFSRAITNNKIKYRLTHLSYFINKNY